jgi:hypothetical protein
MGSRKRQMHLANSLMGSEIYDPYGVTGNSTKRLLAKKLLSESGRFKPRNGQYPHSQGLADLASTGLGLYSNYLANQEDNEVMAAEQKDYSRGVNEAMNMMRPTSETIERMREPYDDDLMKQEQVAKRTRDIGNQQDFINELEKPGHPGPALGYAQRSMEEKQDDWISAMNEARSNADPVGTGDYTQRETPGDMDGAIQSMMSSNNRRLQNIGATLLGQRMKNQFSNNLGNFEEKERIKKKYRDPIRNPIDDYESKLNLKNRLAPPTQFEGWVMDQEGMGESTLHDVRTGKKKVPSELIEKWKKLGGAKVEVNVIPDQKVPVGYYVKKGPGGKPLLDDDGGYVLGKMSGKENSAEKAGKNAMFKSAHDTMGKIFNSYFQKSKDGKSFLPKYKDKNIAWKTNIPFVDGLPGDTRARNVYAWVTDVINAKLRGETGAAANPDEVKSIRARFMPGIGDTEDSAFEKLSQLRRFIDMTIQEMNDAGFLNTKIDEQEKERRRLEGVRENSDTLSLKTNEELGEGLD